LDGLRHAERMPKADEPISIRDLYPDKSDEWYREAEENLNAYIDETWESYQEIRSDPARYALLKEVVRLRRLLKEKGIPEPD
jgi:hypothetical protein